MAKRVFVAEVAQWIEQLSGLLHQANAWRLAPILWGMLFSRGRRTVACWLRTAELSKDYQDYYYFRRCALAAGGADRLSRLAATVRHRRYTDQALRTEGRRRRHPS